MVLVQMPGGIRVSDHSLHDVIPRDEIPEDRAGALLEPRAHFRQLQDVGHPMLQHEAVSGEDGKDRDAPVRQEGEYSYGVRAKRERRADRAPKRVEETQSGPSERRRGKRPAAEEPAE